MSARVDPQFLAELKKYGTVSVEACFNCGNCTAICPLAATGETFPRRLIRYAQLGLKKPLLNSKELWLCYYCGQCTQTCPRKAEPGEFMAAARRYAIASYDPLGLARLLYTSPILSVGFLILLAIVIALTLYTGRGDMATNTLRLFEFIPVTTIHNLGVATIILVALTGLLSLGNMLIQVRRANPLLATPGVRLNWAGALWETIAVEVLAARRYRQDCESTGQRRPWFLQPWFIHATILWGFLGLLAATALNYSLDLLGIKAAGTWVPLWYPVRLLGTIAGLLLIYGTSVAIFSRLRKRDEATAHSHLSDWIFLGLLWLTGISGFVIEIALYLPRPTPWAYWTLLLHVTLAIVLLLLIPFSKFAHALYRTAALYIHALKPLPATGEAKAGLEHANS